MNIRAKGLLQFLGSGVVFGVVIGWFMQQRAADPAFKLPGGIFSLLMMMAPGGFALAGLMQLMTGVPFSCAACMSSVGVGNVPPPVPKKETGLEPESEIFTSSIICPMLISAHTTAFTLPRLAQA